jgi:hypothetical protein
MTRISDTAQIWNSLLFKGPLAVYLDVLEESARGHTKADHADVVAVKNLQGVQKDRPVVDHINYYTF